MTCRNAVAVLGVTLAGLATAGFFSSEPSFASLDGAVVETVTRAIPYPNAIVVSHGGNYGDYIYVASRGTDIFRISPSGTVEYFTTRRAGNGQIDALYFDETPDRRFGGSLFAVMDCLAGPCLAGVDRIQPDGTVQAFVNGAVTSPRLLGLYDGLIDPTGQFGYNMLLADFEADNNGSPSNIIRVLPSGAVSAYDGVAVRGVLGMDIDRWGLFGGDLLVANRAAAPWWEGDNSVWRVHPDGSRGVLVGTLPEGTPWRVLVDGAGAIGGHALVSYPSAEMVIEFDANGHEVARVSTPGISEGTLAQDRGGEFGGQFFYAAQLLHEVRRIKFPEPAQEVCNGIDDNGDGTIDDGFDLGAPCVSGIGGCTVAGLTVCSLDGMSATCDATPMDPSDEICDGVDNDCDGVLPENERDVDGDGSAACEGDCNDSDTRIGPAAEEILDGLDNDCNGFVDDGLDYDGDGVPDLLDDCPGTIAGTGVGPNGCTICVVDPDDDGDTYPASIDCDDQDPAINPGASELCNGKDDNCNNSIDEGFDLDGDGFTSCGSDAIQADCDDSLGSVHPGGVELPGNGIDENCDGSLGSCDPNAMWRNHGEFVRCVADEVNTLVASGAVTQEQGDLLVQSASKSKTGKAE